MARVSVATETVGRDGVMPALTAPTVDGDVIDAGDVRLVVTNNGTAAHDVTVRTPLTIDDLAVEEMVVTVPAGETVYPGLFPRRTFGQPAGANESGSDDQGRVYVDYDTGSDADLVRAVVSI